MGIRPTDHAETTSSIDSAIAAPSLDGAAGNDIAIGGAGADKITRGDGVDSALYATATAGVTANLFDDTLNTGDAAGDIYSGIEVLMGSAFKKSGAPSAGVRVSYSGGNGGSLSGGGTG